LTGDTGGTHLVTPGVLPTRQDLLLFKLLIRLLLPVFGNPGKQKV